MRPNFRARAAVVIVFLASGFVVPLWSQAAVAREPQHPITDPDWAQVTFVVATRADSPAGDSRSRVWRFDVTVLHDDQGWDHYADLWQIVDPRSGDVLGERVLLHPHVEEQPFTRSLSGVTIPERLTTVIVRARCRVHGFGGAEVTVDLTEDRGDNFEVRSHQ